MLNWSSNFNIAFVAALGVAIVFLLASTIAVAAKGKRKCNAFDVILRVISTLLFIASAAMLAASILTLTDGGYCIAIFADKPFLVWGESITELPLPELFVALSSSIGLMLVALLFICSLAALVVDCLVANKKTNKAKKQTVQKTPEQLKREAELDKIRRIGEDAVKRTGHAAKYAETSSQKRPATARPQTSASSASANANASANAAAKTSSVQTEAEPTPAPASDWRTQVEPEHTEFVGLSHSDDPDFDTFDSFDEPPQQARPAEQDDIVVIERDLEPETEQEPNIEEQEPTVEPEAEQELELEEEPEYELEQEQSIEPEEEPEYEQEAKFEEQEQSVVPEAEQELELEEEPEYELEQEQEIEPETEYEQELDIAEQESAVEPEAEQELEPETESEEEQPVVSEREVEQEQVAERPVYDEYEPDRDIYIPKIRTIVKDNGDAEAAKPSAPRSASGTSRKKPAAKTGAVAKPAAKPTNKKSTKPAAVKKAPAKKPSAKKVGIAASKPAAISPEKKLPVTRRYVILDRRNAVNMFGEYLKDRSQAEKDKLKSSINTIIIE